MNVFGRHFCEGRHEAPDVNTFGIELFAAFMSSSRFFALERRQDLERRDLAMGEMRRQSRSHIGGRPVPALGMSLRSPFAMQPLPLGAHGNLERRVQIRRCITDAIALRLQLDDGTEMR